MWINIDRRQIFLKAYCISIVIVYVLLPVTHVLIHLAVKINSIIIIITVSLSLHHSHPCIIYEVNMRHIQDKYDAVMKQISIFFSKYEVLSTAIFKYCQNIIKLLLLIFKYTVGKPYPIIALNVHFCWTKNNGRFVYPKHWQAFIRAI